jgi:D-glucosaminate-6-phosphate ammonia-lyase
MTNPFAALGVEPIVNACSPMTRLSGGLMRPEVASAMAEAAQACVDIAALQDAAGARLAALSGAEAGMVTAGAAAGLMLAAAACIAGLDPTAMSGLPDTAGRPNEILMAKSQRNFYDHAARQVGARIVDVGLPDRYSGAGSRDAELWEFAAAIGERTAAILYVADPRAEPDLVGLAGLANARSIPLLVDAAASLPPAANLRGFIAAGADLVAFSGGKLVGGPQASGILVGRRRLIQSALLQQLDHDVGFAQWSPPPILRTAELVGLPHHGIGRPAKVGKEQIVGLMTALELFLAEDPVERWRGWHACCARMAEGLAGLPGVEVTIRGRVEDEVPPAVVLDFPARTPAEVGTLIKRLQDGHPSVRVNAAERRQSRILLGPACLRPGEEAVVVSRLRGECAGEPVTGRAPDKGTRNASPRACHS